MSRPRSSSRLLLLVVALTALGLCSPFAGAVAMRHRNNKEQLKQQVIELEQQWRTATMNADIPLMDRLLSEDYVGISLTGQVNTKVMQLDRLRKRTLVITRIDLNDVRVKLIGSIAIVTSRAEVEGMDEGRQMSGSFRYIRIYQRLPSGIWKITNFEPTRLPGEGEHKVSQSTTQPPTP